MGAIITADRRGLVHVLAGPSSGARVCWAPACRRIRRSDHKPYGFAASLQGCGRITRAFGVKTGCLQQPAKIPIMESEMGEMSIKHHRPRPAAGEPAREIGFRRNLRASTRPPVTGQIETRDFNLGFTLAGGQVFRWGRDVDGWWKGVAYETVFHLRQVGDTLQYRTGASTVATYRGEMSVGEFLAWYLRLNERPRIRVPQGDRYLRRARDLLKGFRFVRQMPFECVISYVLSVQAHMNLTKRRVNFLAETSGRQVEFMGSRYCTFPGPDALARLTGPYFRLNRFGWRSERVVAAARFVSRRAGGQPARLTLDNWREIVDALKARPGTGVGLKVGKCIDLFALERLDSVPVDTWVLKFAREWYQVKGSDRKVCAWAEERGGRNAGYMNEYLFAYYRELNGPSLHDRVISFCASDAPSVELPMLDGS